MGVVVWNHLLCILCVVGKQAEDKEVLSGISGLVKENIEVLGGRTSEEGYIVDDRGLCGDADLLSLQFN